MNEQKRRLQDERELIERRIGFPQKLAWGLVAFGLFLGLLGLMALPDANRFGLTNLSALGSYLQGSVSSVWALAGLLFIYVAFLGQKQQLLLQQEEIQAEKERQESDHQKRVNGVLRAIQYELEILDEYYAITSGKHLAALKEGQAYNVYFSLTEKYFIVYPNNTEIVGQIDDPELCKAIVRTYNMANFLLEMYRINNWYLERCFSGHMTEQQTDKKLIEHAPSLKRADADLKSETSVLLAKINGYLAKHP